MLGECNETLSLLNNTRSILQQTYSHAFYTNIVQFLYGFGLPTVCIIGILGNVFNLIVLTGKRMQKSLREAERSANAYLVALAVSDLCFCLAAFPTTFLQHETHTYLPHMKVLLYYDMSSAAIISCFILTSTWITVVMASERYLAICHPLRSRKLLSIRSTRWSICVVYVFAFISNLPLMWRYETTENKCGDNVISYSIRQKTIHSLMFDHFYRVYWAIIGNVIPLVLLLFANVCLIKKIKKSMQMRKSFTDKKLKNHKESGSSTSKVTLTLIAIVVLFLILVAPSEIGKHIAYLIDNDVNENYTYKSVEVVTNFMQTINFAVNFLVYCIIHRSFRQGMKYVLCRYCRRSEFEFQYSTRASCKCHELTKLKPKPNNRVNISFRCSESGKCSDSGNTSDSIRHDNTGTLV